MRSLLLRALAFILILVALVYINMWVFRSFMPMAWFITFIGSVIGLILFPYKKFFKTNIN